MSELTDGPVHLRTLRSSARLTQEQLAELAGLHERTVRGLETGRILAPRRSTLDLLARALGLDVRRHTTLLAAWGQHDLSPVDGRHPPLTRETYSEIEDFLALSARQTMAVSVSETVEIGPDRRPLRRRTQEVIIALEDGATTRSLFFDPEDPTVDVARLHVDDLENASVLREWMDESGSSKLFQISLGRRLAVGETHILRYAVNSAQARRASAIRMPDSGREIGGFLRSPALYLLEVRFDPTMLPRSCDQVYQPRPLAPAQVTARLQVNNCHAAHIALINPKPGGHGVAWSW